MTCSSRCDCDTNINSERQQMPWYRDVFDIFSLCGQKGTGSVNEWLPRLNTYREECHESVCTILHIFDFSYIKIVNIFLLTAWYWFQLFCPVLLPIIFTCARRRLYKKRKNTTDSIASEADRCAAEYKLDWILSRCLCSWLNRLMSNSFSFHHQTQEDHIFQKRHPTMPLHANLCLSSWPWRVQGTNIKTKHASCCITEASWKIPLCVPLWWIQLIAIDFWGHTRSFCWFALNFSLSRR